MASKDYPRTPDGRYFVSKGRLWRCTDPSLEESERKKLVKALMKARNAVRLAKSETEEKQARAQVNEAKIALGERGPVWWNDDMPAQDRLHPKNSVYSDWWNDLPASKREAGDE